jgi:hypothetical protein
VPEPQPEPGPIPEPRRETEPVERPSPAGAWTIEALERLVNEHRENFPDRALEWETYLFYLREHASADGSLPRSLDPLIADVFADAVQA